MNIVTWLAPSVLIGGFHLNGLDPTEGNELVEMADRLLLRDTLYYTGHCTGQAQYDFLKTRMGDRLHALSSGQIIEL